MAKMGRPKKQISQKQFEDLCQIQCTQEEICAVLDVDEKTLQKWCKETYEQDFSQVFAENEKVGKKTSQKGCFFNLFKKSSR